MWHSYGSDDWFEFWDRNFPFPFPPHRFWREMVRRSGQEEGRIVITDIREAEGSLQRNLVGFLSYRFAGIKRWAEWIRGVARHGKSGSNEPGKGASCGKGQGSSPPPPAVGAGGGLQVQVSCSHPGCGFTSRQLISSIGCISAVRRHRSRAMFFRAGIFLQVMDPCCQNGEKIQQSFASRPITIRLSRGSEMVSSASDYGPFAPVVGYAGTIMAAGATLFLMWGGKMEKWRPPDDDLPGTAQTLVPNCIS